MPVPEAVDFKKDREQAFTDWIRREISQMEGDRAQLEQKWVDAITMYRARVLDNGTSDVPFIGASDIEFPLTSMHFEPVYADLMQTLHIPRDFFSVTALRSETVGTAKPFQEFLSLVETQDIRMRSVNEKAFIDLILLGTTVYKDRIKHQSKNVRDYNDAGEIVDRTKVEFRPVVQHVPLQDFFIPAHATRIDPDQIGGAPWVSHRFRLTLGQFNERAEGQSPFLPNYRPEAVESVTSWLESTLEDEVEEAQRIEDEYQPFEDRKITLHEVWARFDTDDDGIDEDIRVVWHQRTGTILQATHNPHVHGDRPFHAATYIPGPGFYGIGIAEADEWAQLTMTRLMNNAVNNTLIANARMFSVPQGAVVSPDEAIYPGKMWTLGPNEKVDSVQMGEVYPSIFSMMGQMMQWAEQRTSVSETRQGNVGNLPDRTPATTVLSTLQEGNKKFDMVLANLRENALAKIGQHVVQNLVQISKSDPRYIALAHQVLGREDGTKISEILQGPVHDIEEKFGISVTATSSQVNKEVEKQNFVSLAQVLGQLYPQILQYAQAMGDQNLLVESVRAGFTGQVELLRRLLETYDIQNPEEFVPRQGQEAGQMMGQSPGQGGPGGPAFDPGSGLGGGAGSPFAGAEDPLSALLGLG